MVIEENSINLVQLGNNVTFFSNPGSFTLNLQLLVGLLNLGQLLCKLDSLLLYLSVSVVLNTLESSLKVLLGFSGYLCRYFLTFNLGAINLILNNSYQKDSYDVL